MMARAPLWSPVRASTPAHCTNWLVHDSPFTLSVLQMSMKGRGPMAAPRRQPVIAYFLENV